MRRIVDWLRPGGVLGPHFGLALNKRGAFVHSTASWFKWLPCFIGDAITAVWNPVVCRLRGHDDTLWHVREAFVAMTPDHPLYEDRAAYLGDNRVRCCDCCAELTGCAGNHPALPAAEPDR